MANESTDSTFHNIAEWSAIADSVLSQAQKLGATDAEISVGTQLGYSVTVRLGEVELLEYQRDRDVSITVYYDHRSATTTTADISTEALQQAVKRACDIAKLLEPDPCCGLPDTDRMAMEYPDLDLFHPWDLSAKEAIALAKEAESTGLSKDKAIQNSEGFTINNHGYGYLYANTQGFLGHYNTTRHSMSCSLVAIDTVDGSMQRDHYYTVARDSNALQSPEAVVQSTVERTVRRLGARQLSTRRCPVLFAPEVARGFIGHLIAGIHGSALYREASFLCHQLHQPILPDFIHLEERPQVPKALGSAPFDREGVATVSRHLVKEGVLQGYVLDTYAARRLGMQTTGNAGGIHNLYLQGQGVASKTFNALLQEMDTGLLVIELMGHGVNMVTGEYSRGAFGFWVERGLIQYPVHEITISGALAELFLGIRAIGEDVDHRGRIHTGSILLDVMTVAGA